MLKLNFEKILIHHFLSYGDTEIKLDNRGYVLVSGINRKMEDNAKSNGSGKSSWVSAICFALTGETIQGLHSNLPNIQFDDGCYVDLYFNVNGVKYRLLRSKDDKKLGTDLKIYINGEDKSGKGVRESQQLLDQFLPDITSQLIGSVIILGQGLPFKFSSNTPSGRKEMLEKLSKSDFMIQDIKLRIDKRLTELNNKIRENEDSTLKLETEKSLTNQRLINYKTELNNVGPCDILNISINDKNTSLISKESEKDILTNSYNSHTNDLEKLNSDYNEKKEENFKKLDLNRVDHDEISSQFNSKKSVLNNNIFSLKSEINKLKSITDVCPTCGQKIPGASKPDTTKQEQELKFYSEQLDSLNSEINLDTAEYNDSVKVLNEKFNKESSDLKENINALSATTSNEKLKIDLINSEITKLKIELTKLESEKENYGLNIKRLKDSIEETNKSLISIDEKLFYNSGVNSDLSEHLSAVSKMNTLVKRDFRGFLLINIIDFINNKAKEYCSKVFNTDDIEIKINGNDIELNFSKKPYENLSGGEKQKVDIITQLAIRDMMCRYLDFSSNLLALDEIFDNLDSLGCDKVLNLISTELTDVESLFIISHHANELSIPYDYEMVVEKDTNGISTIN